MTYFLDTNICIFYLNGNFPFVSEKLRAIPRNNIKLSSIVVAELCYGASKSQQREHNLSQCSQFIALYDIIPFEREAALIYGEIRANLETKGMTIGGNDFIIAATVLANKAILVTNNIKEFSRVDGLILEDWTARTA
jgi:tRNA(fMet)-specific endonuclease VapC